MFMSMPDFKFMSVTVLKSLAMVISEPMLVITVKFMLMSESLAMFKSMPMPITTTKFMPVAKINRAVAGIMFMLRGLGLPAEYC